MAAAGLVAALGGTNEEAEHAAELAFQNAFVRSGQGALDCRPKIRGVAPALREDADPNARSARKPQGAGQGPGLLGPFEGREKDPAVRKD